MTTPKTTVRPKSLRYITTNGKKQAVILDLDEFKTLANTIENLQNALALEKAKYRVDNFATVKSLSSEKAAKLVTIMKRPARVKLLETLMQDSSLREDMEDVLLIEKRRHQKGVPLEKFAERMRRQGRLK